MTGRRSYDIVHAFITRIWSADSKYSRPMKFLVIGMVNTAFGYSIFAVLYLLTSSHRLAIVVATIVGVVFNFFTTGRLVFQNTSNALMFRFILGYVVSLSANFILLELLVRSGIHPLIAQILCLPPIVVLTYVINARWVFQNKILRS